MNFNLIFPKGFILFGFFKILSKFNIFGDFFSYITLNIIKKLNDCFHGMINCECQNNQRCLFHKTRILVKAV